MSQAPRRGTSRAPSRTSSASSDTRASIPANNAFNKDGRKEGSGPPLSEMDMHVVLATLLDNTPETFAVWTASLSPTEAVVLRHFLIDQCDKKVARRLRTSPNTVRNQMSAILRKLKFASRAELLVSATMALMLVPNRTATA